MRLAIIMAAAATLAATAAAAGPLDECSALTTTKPDTTACLRTRAEGVDKALAAVLSDARAAAKRLEAETDAASGAVKRLDASEAAFEAYRKATCDEALPPMWAGGTGTGGAILACRIRLGRERIETLRRNYPG